MSNIPFLAIDWSAVRKQEQKGTTGFSTSQSMEWEGLRIRLVEYSENYFADHWCKKGHIVHCLEGEFISEQETGERVRFTAGMTYVVSDDLSSHRSSSAGGVKLLIVDGDFLKLKKQSNE